MGKVAKESDDDDDDEHFDIVEDWGEGGGGGGGGEGEDGDGYSMKMSIIDGNNQRAITRYLFEIPKENDRSAN